MEISKGLKFKTGLKDGLPIGLGYLSVAFAFGVKASILEVPVFITILISMTNLTSAGQLAGLDVLVFGGGVLELIVCQLVINSRYFLMSVSLSQKRGENFPLLSRLILSATITDEIFGVAISKGQKINKNYFYGLSLLPYVCWTLGTALGAIAGNILPQSLTNSLNIAMYAMFIAIILPPSMKEKGVFLAVILGGAISCAFTFVPIINNLSSGFVIVISAIISAVIVSIFFPIEKGDNSNA